MLQNKEYRHFRIAVIFSLVLALAIGIFLMIYGKNESFLIINKFNSPSFDYFFRFYTYLGDGIIWIPLFAYVLMLKRDFLIPVIAALVFCTILTQVLKHGVFPESLRPIGTFKDQIHTITNVEVYRFNSFPSGHTSTAFTLALLMAFIVKRDFWVFFFPIIAFFVGYSRVYLAEHFVTDVFAGVFVGIISSSLALLVYEVWRRRNEGLGFRV